MASNVFSWNLKENCVDFDYSFQMKALIHVMEIGVFANGILFLSLY